RTAYAHPSHHNAPIQHYTLSLHDALPLSTPDQTPAIHIRPEARLQPDHTPAATVKHKAQATAVQVLVRNAAAATTHCLHKYTSPDRKSTRLNSSQVKISYAVFSLKKKKET